MAQLTLGYGDIPVGSVEDAFYSDDTWCGDFTMAPTPASGPLEERIREFEQFSQSWHRRLEESDDAEAVEFERFNDLISSGLWHAEPAAGTALRISEAPIFMEGEVSWRPAKSR
jgi:hypothetical protein